MLFGGVRLPFLYLFLASDGHRHPSWNSELLNCAQAVERLTRERDELGERCAALESQVQAQHAQQAQQAAATRQPGGLVQELEQQAAMLRKDKVLLTSEVATLKAQLSDHARELNISRLQVGPCFVADEMWAGRSWCTGCNRPCGAVLRVTFALCWLCLGAVMLRYRLPLLAPSRCALSHAVFIVVSVCRMRPGDSHGAHPGADTEGKRAAWGAGSEPAGCCPLTCAHQ